MFQGSSLRGDPRRPSVSGDSVPVVRLKRPAEVGQCAVERTLTLRSRPGVGPRGGGPAPPVTPSETLPTTPGYRSTGGCLDLSGVCRSPDVGSGP